MQKEKVIILGAGPAGLTAAYELLKRSDQYQVILIEKDDMVGGISKTKTTQYGKMDLGGHRFFTKQERVMSLWNEILYPQGKEAKDEVALQQKNLFLVAGGMDPEKEDDVFLKRNRVSRIYYHNHFFDYPIRMNFQTISHMGFFTTFVAGISYLKAQLLKEPENSLENFYINRFGRKLYDMFFRSYTEKLWGMSPKEISPSWGRQRVKGISIFAILKDNIRKKFHIHGEVETSLIESFYYPKYGPGQMWGKMKDKISSMGGVFYFSSSVCKICRRRNHIVSVTIKKGSKIEVLQGDYFFSSLPIQDFVSFLSPCFKNEIAIIARELPYRSFVTVGVLVKKLKLKNETKIRTIQGRIPDCWIYIQENSVEVGRIQIFNNWSPYLVKDNDHTIFLGLEYFCNQFDSRWNRSDLEWMELAKGELIEMGFLEASDIIGCHVERVEKAYPAYFGSYEKIDQVITYLDRIDNLYCIGRNGQHRYNNMDHSMMTAFLAVDHLLGNQVERSDIWNVNTEGVYHEGEK